MATQGKGKRRTKGKTLSLGSFLQEETNAPEGYTVRHATLNWADAMENDEIEDKMIFDPYKKESSDKVMLPTAPKADRGPNVDMNKIPNSGPFKVYIGNIAYETTEMDIENFFEKLTITKVQLPKEDGGKGRIRGFGYAEFSDRESLIEALNMNNEVLNGRHLRVSLPGDNEGDRPKREERDDRTSCDWRKAPRDETAFKEREPFRSGREEGSFRPAREEGGFRSTKDEGGFRSEGSDSFRSGRIESSRPPAGREDGFRSGRDDSFRSGRDDGFRSEGADSFRSGRTEGFRSEGQDSFRSGSNFSRNGGSDREPYGGRPSFEDRRSQDRYGSDSSSFGQSRDRYSRNDDRGGFGGPSERRGFDGGGSRGMDRRDGGFGGYEKGRDYAPRATSPQDSRSPGRDDKTNEAPKERPKLQLTRRTKPVESKDNAVTASSAIFGGAKPVDTATKEREIEAKLLKERAKPMDGDRAGAVSPLSGERIRRISSNSNASASTRSRKGSESREESSRPEPYRAARGRPQSQSDSIDSDKGSSPNNRHGNGASARPPANPKSPLGVKNPRDVQPDGRRDGGPPLDEPEPKYTSMNKYEALNPEDCN